MLISDPEGNLREGMSVLARSRKYSANVPGGHVGFLLATIFRK
jgi:hypothetical protein